ncbi:MAG: putative Ig domain-containing protein [Thermoanaerobaculia bacterium]|nr:putative Ig domain-containing protein [Thermoanaerobaculia bacterium]
MRTDFRIRSGLIGFILTLTLGLTGAALADDNDDEDSQLRDRSAYFPLFFQGVTDEPAEPDDRGATVKKPKLAEEFLPGFWSLALRSLTFEASLLDQVDCIEDKSDATPSPLASLAICSQVEVPSDTGDPTVRTFRFNPDDELRSYKITVNPGDWFRSAADFTAAYTTAKSYPLYVDRSDDPLLEKTSEREALHFLSWSFGKRLLAGLSATGSYTKRASLVDNTLLPAPMLRRDRYEDTLSVEFDPDRLLVYPGDLASAYDALLAHTQLAPDSGSGLPADQCLIRAGESGADGEEVKVDTLDCFTKVCQQEKNGDLFACLGALSKRKVSRRGLAGLLPKIKYEEKDQFDFLLNGGVFVPQAFLEDSLHTWTVTWDLGEALDSADHRRQALKAIATHQKLVAQDVARDAKKKLTLQVPSYSLRYPAGTEFIEFLLARYDNGEFADAKWSGVRLDGGKKTSLAKIGLSVNEKPGVLMGKVTKPDTYTVELTAKDDYGKTATATVTLTVH